MGYHRTQTAYRAIVLVFVGAVILVLVLSPFFNSDVPSILAGVILVLAFGIAVIFTRLTVVVAEGSVTAAFGFGWPKRTIDVAKITAVRQVRNRWYQGWGIRWIKGGWLYNVWGLDAIELELSSGRKFRIGTDDPEGLLAALTHASPV